MSKEVATNDFPSIINQILKSTGAPVLAITNDDLLVDELISTAHDSDSSPGVRLLTSESLLKRMRNDFVTATYAADLVADDDLAIRSATFDPGNTMFIGEDSVTGVLTAGGVGVPIVTEDDAFVEEAARYYGNLWDDADTFSLRTLPFSQMQATLLDQMNSSVEQDLTDAIQNCDCVREGEIDKADLFLIIAAKHDMLFYDLGVWAEDIQLVSKATLSRSKTSLEDRGIIATDKVPVDIGRPRFRLKLGDPRFDGAEICEILSEIAN